MRFLAFADPQGHAAPVAAILQVARRMGEAEVVCLGNAVGSGPEPAETVARLRKARVHLVRGPRDAAALGMPVADALRYEGKSNASRLEKADLAYLREASPPRRLVSGGKRILLTSEESPDPGEADVVIRPGPLASVVTVDGRLEAVTGRAADERGEATYVLYDATTGEARIDSVTWKLSNAERTRHI